MTVFLSSITAGSGDDIVITFELCGTHGSERVKCVIPIAVYTDYGLTNGECSCELYDSVAHAADVYAAFKRGIYILGFGSSSENALISKLVAKGIARDIAREAVKQIGERGYLDEAENALREAERCVEKLWGESRVKAALQQKRYSPEAIEDALFTLQDREVDFDANCKTLIASRYQKIPEDRAQMQKLVAAVCRMGYSVSQIRSACKALLAEQRRPDPYK
jgi:SOS response regulatory protein OraA/RecX